jgi:hypothetical protein
MAEKSADVICEGKAVHRNDSLRQGFASDALAWKREEMPRVAQRWHGKERSGVAMAQQREDILLKGETSMKKVIVGVVSVLASALLMAGCNKQVVDLTYEYSWAQLKMPDGTIVEGDIESWCDYEGDQLQVVIDGVTYLVHSSNIVMRH